MTRLGQIIFAVILTLSLSVAALAGTITGSRTTSVGTITGSSTGTITGSRTGTITGSRTGTITGSVSGSRAGTITGSWNTEAGVFAPMNQDEIFTKALNIMFGLVW